jgi:uroporphyrinogen-III decarboxylase
LEVTAQAAIRFALAQIKAGADMIGVGDAVCSLMRPRAYREFGLPYEQRIIQAIHSAGSKVKYTSRQTSTRHLAVMTKRGPNRGVDWMVPYTEATPVSRRIGE